MDKGIVKINKKMDSGEITILTISADNKTTL